VAAQQKQGHHQRPQPISPSIRVADFSTTFSISDSLNVLGLKKCTAVLFHSLARSPCSKCAKTSLVSPLQEGSCGLKLLCMGFVLIHRSYIYTACRSHATLVACAWVRQARRCLFLGFSSLVVRAGTLALAVLPSVSRGWCWLLALILEER